MFCCLLKKKLTFTLSRLETNYVSFSHLKFLVFKAQPVLSKLSEAAPLDERDRISITRTPSLRYRTVYSYFESLLLKLINVRHLLKPEQQTFYHCGSRKTEHN